MENALIAVLFSFLLIELLVLVFASKKPLCRFITSLILTPILYLVPVLFWIPITALNLQILRHNFFFFLMIITVVGWYIFIFSKVGEELINGIAEKIEIFIDDLIEKRKGN